MRGKEVEQMELKKQNLSTEELNEVNFFDVVINNAGCNVTVE